MEPRGVAIGWKEPRNAPSVTIAAPVFGAPLPVTSTAPISRELGSELTARKDPLAGLNANAND